MTSHWSFNPQLPNVTGFLGAITFAAMILIIQSAKELQFSEVLIPSTAIVSFFFIIATLGGATDQRNSPNLTPYFKNLVKFTLFMGLFMLIFLIIPLLVYSFSEIGAVIVFVIEFIIMWLYIKHAPDEYDPNPRS